MIRSFVESDTDAILRIIGESGQFDADGIVMISDRISEYLKGGSDSIWLTAFDPAPIGVAYCVPEPAADSVWNLLMLWTRADRHRTGYGAALVGEVERQVQGKEARLLIVETSGLTAFKPARAFYEKCGFQYEATVRDFFSDGDDKLIYTKRFALGTAQPSLDSKISD